MVSQSKIVLPDPDGFMTRAEVANFFRRSMTTFERWRREEAADFPRARRIGKSLLWRRRDVNEWADRQPEA